MSQGNILSDFVKKYKLTIPNPLAQSLAIAAFTVPASYMLKKPMYRFLKNRVRDPRISMALFGTSPNEAVRSIDLMQSSWSGKHGIPLAFASIAPLVALGLNTVPGAKNFGWTLWNPKIMKKSLSLSKEAALFLTYGYQPQLDLSQNIHRQQAINMINNNPFLLLQDPYARHLGTSIITAAPFVGTTTTLGNVYDSAVNKFLNKLEFQGLGNKVVKGVVSGALAGMFTDVVGTVLGMPMNIRNGLANTIGVGKALHSILT